MSKKLKIWGALLTIVVVINGYLLLKNNDVIPKSYYIDNMQHAMSDVHTKELKKEGMLATSNEVLIAAPIQAIESVLVKRGDEVFAQKLEIERSAYQTELNELDSILSALESESGNSQPSTAADSTTLGDSDVWNLNLSLELGIEQSTPTAEGKAIIRRHIAETERQLEIVDAMITQLTSQQALTSPVDGVVGEVMQEGDTITFVIYPSEKSIITYVDVEQWKRVEVQQRAEVIVRAGEEDEYIVEGTVIEKHEVPAEESLWYKELVKHKKVDPSETLYEVQIQPMDMLADFPYGEKVDVTITTDEVFESFIVHSDWIVHYEVPDIGDTHIYTIGYDGKTRLTPVEVAFSKRGTIEKPVEEEVVEQEPVEEETAEEETEQEPTILTVDFNKEEDEVVDEKLYDVTVFTGAIDENTMLLDGTARNIYAPTFRPYPIDTYKWENVGEVTWKDIVKFIVQP